MKQLLIISALLAGSYGAHAQANATSNKWTETNAKTEAAAESDFSRTSIKLQSRKLVFLNLPQISKSAIVNITNNEGEIIHQAKVNPVDNSVDLRYLDKGTYYIHLKYKNEEKKGFVLNL